MTQSQIEIHETLAANSGVDIETFDNGDVYFNAYDSGVEVTVSPQGEILDGDPIAVVSNL